jgi:hypothetical protein
MSAPDARRYCPMGDLDPDRGCTNPEGDRISADQCPRLASCAAERRDLSARFNPPMTNEEICWLWPGAHLGSVGKDEPRWIPHPHRTRGCCVPVVTEIRR